MNQIIFENGSIIQAVDSKGVVIRGKRAELRHWMYDFERNDIALSFLDEFVNKENINSANDGIIFMSSSRKIK